MLDLPILPAGAMPAPAPGPNGSSQTSTDGVSFEDALSTASASAATDEATEPASTTTPIDEATLAALAALAGVATVQVAVTPAVAPQMPIGDAQPAGPTPDITILVPVTKPGPRLELADPNPLAPTPEAGAEPEATAPVLEDAQPVRGALPGRGNSFGDVWVNAARKHGVVDAAPLGAAAAAATTPTSLPLGATADAQPEATAPAAKGTRVSPVAPTVLEAATAETPPTPTVTGGTTQTVAPVTETKIEPARLAEVQPKDVIAQIQLAVEDLEGQKLETVKITLQPEELGRIELRVTHGADHGLQVSVRAEQPHTAVLLENHLTELRSNLSASGLDVANITISAGLGSQHQQSNRSFQGSRSFGINLRGIKGGETDPYASDRPIVMRLNGARGWSAAGVDLSI